MTRQPTIFAREILSKLYSKPIEGPAFVAGCGDGSEAREFHINFSVPTIGMDFRAVETEDGSLKIIKGDITKLPYPDNNFSIIYCYHVLEHVADPVVAINELHRVLKPGHPLYIGFPNRNRLLAYYALPIPIADKIKKNWGDIKMRIRGKFRNEYGAHAGFTHNEFMIIAKTCFSDVKDARNIYYFTQYPRMTCFLRFLTWTGLSKYIFPCNYYVCIKS